MSAAWFILFYSFPLHLWTVRKINVLKQARSREAPTCHLLWLCQQNKSTPNSERKAGWLFNLHFSLHRKLGILFGWKCVQWVAAKKKRQELGLGRLKWRGGECQYKLSFLRVQFNFWKQIHVRLKGICWIFMDFEIAYYPGFALNFVQQPVWGYEFCRERHLNCFCRAVVLQPLSES